MVTLEIADQEKKFVHMTGTRASKDPGAKHDYAAFFMTENPSLVKSESSNSTIHMRIVFKRSISIDTVNTFLPSMILILLSYMTTYFKLPKSFDIAIAVNLSVMLTMTTLLISVLNKLPPTPYIKWLEFWLIFAQFVPFINTLLITITQALDDSRKEKKRRTKKDRKSKQVARNRGERNVCWGADGENITEVT